MGSCWDLPVGLWEVLCFLDGSSIDWNSHRLLTIAYLLTPARAITGTCHGGSSPRGPYGT